MNTSSSGIGHSPSVMRNAGTQKAVATTAVSAIESARCAAEGRVLPAAFMADSHRPVSSGAPSEREDRIHWEAVEDISEMLHEGLFHEALPLLKAILEADPLNPYAFHLLG